MSDRPTIGIVASGSYLPPERKPLDAVLRDEEVPTEGLALDVDFGADIGIEAVHLAAGEPPSAVGLEAARRALERAAVEPRELDLIVDFTSIPEDFPAPTWAAAGLVQRELGAERAVATAVNTGGCASFHVALKAACAWMRTTPGWDTALLFAGDKTPELNKVYYPITVTCDGGSAVVLRKGHPRRVVLAAEVVTAGQLHDVWYVPGIAHREAGARGDGSNDRHLHMHSDLERFNEGVIPINLFMFRRVMTTALKRAGLAWDDVDYFVYPTFSTWDQSSFRRGFDIPPDKIYTSGLCRHGHIQENDMVINYDDAVDEGRIGEGDVVMVTTNGAGFSWGAALIRH